MFMNSMLLLIILLFPFCISINTISPGQSITDGKSLISEGKVFELGFFSPGNSSYRYIGIWYVKVSEPTVVWVANRNNPINNSSGALSIDRFGNLVLYSSHSDNQIWSTNVTVNNFTVAQLLDTGNLVLMENGNNRVVWQSFDYPTNTQLPGMKLGTDRKKGLDRFLTSWESHDDPAIGVYSFKVNPSGSPQVILYKGSTTYWRRIILPWTTRSWSIPTESTRKFAFNYSFISNQDERYSTYTLDDTSIFTRVLVDESGTQQFLIWQDGEVRWKNIYTQPKFECDEYGHCGAYGKCNPRHYNNIFECTCLPGYEPRSQRNWSMRDASGGCLRKKQVSMCGKGEGFVKLGPLKLPDSSNAIWVDIGTSTSANCEQACLKNCSCTAFAFFDIPSEGRGCLAWYGKLIDIQENIEDGHELHIRVDSIELVGNVKKSKGIFRKNGKLAIPIVSAALTLFLVVLFVYLHLMKKRKMKGIGGRTWWKQFDITGSSSCSKDPRSNELEGGKRNPDFPIFSLGTLVSATKNFSEDNKLGQGGFGSVYKGQLSSGLEIAVKRLCKSSGQGINEFKNEVMLIAKLQHRNLVKLLGCCIEDEEKMLVYEYMPNKSLDSFIFDETKKSLLDWRKRFEIIIGIARGILYLHQDSRLRIIHRDLKASNILLDAEMNPRISDFGMARIFRGDQIQDRTHRVVGTYGYMSPEYAVFGKFSIKSDVFSFGVILLEIITGKKNIGPYHGGPSLNLIENVWDLWREDKAMEIVDSSLKDSYMLDVMRCIQIGLLCLQENATDRPTMPAVIVMLTSETDLPYPKQPAFIFRRNDNDSDPLKAAGGCLSTNYASISAIEGR